MCLCSRKRKACVQRSAHHRHAFSEKVWLHLSCRARCGQRAASDATWCLGLCSLHNSPQRNACLHPALLFAPATTPRLYVRASGRAVTHAQQARASSLARCAVLWLDSLLSFRRAAPVLWPPPLCLPDGYPIQAERLRCTRKGANLACLGVPTARKHRRAAPFLNTELARTTGRVLGRKVLSASNWLSLPLSLPAFDDECLCASTSSCFFASACCSLCLLPCVRSVLLWQRKKERERESSSAHQPRREYSTARQPLTQLAAENITPAANVLLCHARLPSLCVCACRLL